MGAAMVTLLGCRSRRDAFQQEAPPLPAPLTLASAVASSTPHTLRYVRHELSLPGTLSPRVIALAPATADAGDERYPVVIALHGRGEAQKGPQRGPLGWPEDYALEQALLRITAPPLTRADYFGILDDDAVAAQNRALAAQPFRGVVVLCPYLPDLELAQAEPQDRYGRFLIDTLLPHARERLPIRAGREHTGIDGISLGGAVALHVGSGFPEAFAAVSGLQPAIQTRHAERWAARFAAANAAVGRLAVRLQTSDGDPFKPPTFALGQALTKVGVAHELVLTPGPHDYIYNRGPGAYALLTFHDRVLR